MKKKKKERKKERKEKAACIIIADVKRQNLPVLSPLSHSASLNWSYSGAIATSELFGVNHGPVDR